MKKNFLILIIFLLYQVQGYAQENPQEHNNSKNQQKNYRQEEKKRQIGEPDFAKLNPANLSPEKQQLLKQEYEIHKQNVKTITGVDLILGEKEKNLSREEQRSKGENIRNSIQNLPENKKAEFQQEMQRHRQQMKNITGVELQMPNDNQNNAMGKNIIRNCQSPSPEEMQKHRQVMESLPADKKELVKKEMDRHRLEMKNITGIDLPSPKCENESR